MNIYEIINLKHTYHHRTALEIETLKIPTASIVGLVGPNGSGKSTLLKLLCFVENPTAGQIYFKGNEGRPFSDTVRFRIALLMQEPYLMKRSVFENVAYGLKVRGKTKDITETVEQALERVGLSPGDFMHRRWRELSGGETQRVALAARLILRPEVLLLDEPTASVDVASAELIKEAVLNARRDWNATLIIASHDRHWLNEICDDTLHLYKGRILEKGLENMIFGPWQSDRNGFWRKKLSDGQELVVSRPTADHSTAMIDSRSLTITSTPYSEHNIHTLRGVISSLTRDKSTEEIITTVAVGRLYFTVRTPVEKARKHVFYPGQNVLIHYFPESVRWHPR